MDWTDLQIGVPVKDLETASAIAQMAVPYGIYIEDYSDLMEEAPKIAHIDLIDEELMAKDRDNAIIHIYISPEQSPAEAVAYLAARLDQEPIPYKVDTTAIKEEEWATAWKDYYHPTKIGKKLVVCPTWEDYAPGEGELVMRLDPGMAFGTGTHHTTRLCAGMLEEAVTPGCRVLDMGTGSGILSIAALLLGAGEAVGVDIDPVAVRTAGENAALNGFGPDRFTAVCGELVHDRHLAEKLGNGFDLIAANIVADVIIALAPTFPRHLKPGGAVVCSGVILPRKEEVIAALTAQGLTIARVEEKDGWCAIRGTL